ncbi:MAG: hypothetical protein DDT19_02574 [Syntrophomonadaceae bacterium]|nr:hypothetical protein [Bacillota bacterium]
MAIKIVTGILGSGKTYFCVYEMLKRYFKFSEEFYEWQPKQDVNVEIVTNIAGLKLPVKNLDHEIERAGSIENYFSVPYHTYHVGNESKRVVIIIDEAQKIFHRKFYNKDVFYFFQYSRHLGFDIYLITQDVSSLSKELQNLAEYEVRAVRRSLQAGFFRYLYCIDDKKIGTRNLKRDSKVFAIYHSLEPNRSEFADIKSVPMRNLGYFIILFAFVIFSGYLLFTYFLFPVPDTRDTTGVHQQAEKQEQTENQKSQPNQVIGDNQLAHSQPVQGIQTQKPFYIYTPSGHPDVSQSRVSRQYQDDQGDKQLYNLGGSTSDVRPADTSFFNFSRYVGYMQYTDERTGKVHVIRVYQSPSDYDVQSGIWDRGVRFDRDVLNVGDSPKISETSGFQR